jgi:3-deoxy-manno-octulosonate cytidylyltransferase (CMP-KDO synthetase)
VRQSGICPLPPSRKDGGRRWPFGQIFDRGEEILKGYFLDKGIDFSLIIRYSFLMKAVAIIPARYASTRLPGKPLLVIKGKPLIQYVYERVKSSSVQQVIVATDDERIAAAVKGFGGEAVLTSPSHRSGTERVAEVAADIDADIIVNCQGDEPLIPPVAIDKAIAAFARDPSIMVTTLITPLEKGDDLCNPHLVKVVVDHNGYALYFSRSLIPYPRDVLETGDAGQLSSNKELKGYWQHIGLYAFRRDFLLKLTALPPSPLERREKLEQLRILENGYKIKTVICSTPSIGIDTPEDVERFTALI